MNAKRLISAGAIALCCGQTASVAAEQFQPKPNDVAVQTTQPRLIIRPEDLFPIMRPTRLGMLTLQPPQTTGEVVRISIPVGELVSKAARALSDANHRRAERDADERVRKDLEQFIAATSNRRDATAP